MYMRVVRLSSPVSQFTYSSSSNERTILPPPRPRSAAPTTGPNINTLQLQTQRRILILHSAIERDLGRNRRRARVSPAITTSIAVRRVSFPQRLPRARGALVAPAHGAAVVVVAPVRQDERVGCIVASRNGARHDEGLAGDRVWRAESHVCGASDAVAFCAVAAVSFFAGLRFLEAAAAVELGADAGCFFFDCAFGFGLGRPVVDWKVV